MLTSHGVVYEALWIGAFSCGAVGLCAAAYAIAPARGALAAWLGSSSWDHLEKRHLAARAEKPLKVSRQRSRNSISGQRGIDRSRLGLASPGQSLCGRQQFERRWLGPAGRDALPTNGSASRRRGFSGRYEAGSTLSVEARRGRMTYFTASLAASFAA